MEISKGAIDCLVKRFEGLSLSAYPDPGTGDDPWTIGYGHTDGVNRGDLITQEEADNFLAKDLDKFNKGVSKLVTVDVNQYQFDALVSFAFNVGLNNLKNSTLLKYVNTKFYTAAGNELLRWTRANGKVMNGLVKRREAELNWYRTKF